jgi:hypothetical protein
MVRSDNIRPSAPFRARCASLLSSAGGREILDDLAAFEIAFVVDLLWRVRCGRQRQCQTAARIVMTRFICFPPLFALLDIASRTVAAPKPTSGAGDVAAGLAVVIPGWSEGPDPESRSSGFLLRMPGSDNDGVHHFLSAA